jgi:hypothetical protein
VNAPAQVIVIVADGARPDVLGKAIDGGGLPALAALRADGGLHGVTSTFPSVTGPAYVPFLVGRFPGPVGLPGLRWFDRAREATSFPDYTRSYVGYQMGRVDTDLDADSPTIFELCPESIAALSVIARGLSRKGKVASLSLRSALRAASTHFRGDVAGWLQVDREVSDEVVTRLERDRPRYAFVALTGVDKASHSRGHDSPMVHDALRIVDSLVSRARAIAEENGSWNSTHLWVVSDHGHSSVAHHEDLVRFVRSLGHRTIAHPWVFAHRPEVAVMVSGNAMSHIYLDLERRDRHWWPDLRGRWNHLVHALLARDSVDLLLLPHDEHRTQVLARGRGSAFVTRNGRGISYVRDDGDPLGIGADFTGSEDEAHHATIDTDYPDSIVQIAHLAGSPRSGEIVLSAARDWDFRARYEPIPHVSSHGALHREHMLVPLLVNTPLAATPLRTVDVFPSSLTALGIAPPAALDGRSFLAG